MTTAEADWPVVAGVDGTAEGVHSALYAAELATDLRRPLELLHAYRRSPAINPLLPMADPRARLAVTTVAYGPYSASIDVEVIKLSGERALKHAEAQVRVKHPQLNIRRKLVGGSPSMLLVNASEKAVAVVVARSHRTAVERFFAGSTSWALAAHAIAPAIIVPAEWSDDLSARGVSVGIEGDQSDVDLLRFAFEAAARSGQRLVVLHSCRSVESVYDGIPEVEAEVESLSTQDRRMIVESLAGWREEYPQVEVTTVFSAQPAADALLDEAKSAGLVVVGARGRHRFGGLPLGSVARAVVAHAECPVAIVRMEHTGRRHDFGDILGTARVGPPLY